MTLEAKRIRREYRDLLLGKTIAEDRWSTNRSSRIWERDTPAGCIYTLSERLEILNDTPRFYQRTLRVAVELYGKDVLADPFDDQLDDFQAQVEQVLQPNLHLPSAPELGINPSLSALVQVESGFSEEGDRPMGGRRLTFEVVYGWEVEEGNPADLDVLRTVGIDWDFPPPGADGELEAQDVIEPEVAP